MKIISLSFRPTADGSINTAFNRYRVESMRQFINPSIHQSVNSIIRIRFIVLEYIVYLSSDSFLDDDQLNATILLINIINPKENIYIRHSNI